MNESHRRERMISLRLSEEEYGVLMDYHTYGARNPTELARLALQRIKREPAGSQDGLAARFAELEERVHALETGVARLLVQQRLV